MSRGLGQTEKGGEFNLSKPTIFLSNSITPSISEFRSFPQNRMSAKKLLAIIFSKLYDIYSCFEDGKASNSELYGIIRPFEEIPAEQSHMYEEGNVLVYQYYTPFVVIVAKIQKLHFELFLYLHI